MKLTTFITTGFMAICLLAGAPAYSASSSASDDADQVTNLTVGVLPIADVAPVYMAKQSGLFKKHGLNVKLVPAPGGAAAVTGLISGQMQLAFGSYVPIILAAAKGAPIKIASMTEMTTGVPSGVVALDDSGYKTTADLTNATIAVNALTNIGTVAIRKHLSDAGIDTDSTKLVALPFPNMLVALQSHQVDAAWLVEPFLTQALSNGAHVIFDPFSDPMPDVPMAGFFTSDKYAEKHASAIHKFNATIQQMARKANSNPETFRKVIPTYSKIPESIVKTMGLISFWPVAPRQSMQQLADLMLKYGLMDSEFNTDALYMRTH